MRLLTAFDDEYPSGLREIPDPPFLLFSLGRTDRLRLPAVAIVGSRDASRYGRDVAWREIQWKGCLLEGLAESRAKKKPVLLWVFIDRPADDARC